ncbi:MAG: PLD nuclease N-terminal domain-containing protein [Terrimesophilobacter sp.]
MYVLLSILPLLFMIGALADIITMDPSRVKHLPKFAWIILVILLPLVGSILWFAVGREYVQAANRGGFGDPRRREQPPGSGVPDADSRMRRDSFAGDRFRGDTPAGDTEAQLAALNREIAAHERAERIRHLEEELEQKRNSKDTGS